MALDCGEDGSSSDSFFERVSANSFIVVGKFFSYVVDGSSEGLAEGLMDCDGVSDGTADKEGAREGHADGAMDRDGVADGTADVEGTSDGCGDAVGRSVGIEEGK